MREKEWTAEELEEAVAEMLRSPRPFQVCTGMPQVCHVPSEIIHLEREHFTEPQPIVCPRCGSKDVMKHGTKGGTQYYLCNSCKRRFTAKGAPYGMRTATEQIGAALNMYYDGMSLSAISRHLQDTYDNYVNRSSVYRWITRYTQKAIDTLGSLRANVSETWVVDETVIKVGGKNLWFWDVIDRGTRFLLASHLSRRRTTVDARLVMTKAALRATKPPRYIISDRLAAYIDGIEQVFGAEARHIQSQGFTEELNTNLIERFHGTVKQRTKVLRGFKTTGTAQLILNGFLIHYNFFRPHLTLRDGTPAEVAGVKTPLRSWMHVVREDGKK